MKRCFDFLFSAAVLIAGLPFLLPILLAIWLQDFHSPFYIAPRVGLGGKVFRMVKLRSMVAGADKTGVDSTQSNDARITRVGRFVRRFKMDELGQFWNVFLGHMSVVGPRPQVIQEVNLYTPEERRLLQVKPGVTDMASIVFSDEGDILEGSDDPDLRYHQVIRPWKSRMGLLYVENPRLWLDVKLIVATAVALISKRAALKIVQGILEGLGADNQVRQVARRTEALRPFPPPGSSSIVTQRG